MRRQLRVTVERWPLVKPFVISRGTEYEAEVILVSLAAGGTMGRGESTPYPRYGETTDSVVAAIEAVREPLENDICPNVASMGLRGAAANAVDCALIDLSAKIDGRRAWTLLGESDPLPVRTVVTVVLGSPDAMARDAVAAGAGGLLKIKLGGKDGHDIRRMEAIRAAVPGVRLICDANEGWSVEELREYCPALRHLGVEMIEQPLPAAHDWALAGLSLPIPLCADESCHVAADIGGLMDRYDLVNVKLDKSGGLTGALRVVRAAREREMGVMLGCMLGTSLAMAPGVIAAQGARYVDLDAPLALAHDRCGALIYENGQVMPPDASLWG